MSIETSNLEITPNRLRELETLYAQASVGFGVIDRELRYLRVNDVLARINGTTPARHIGRTVRDVVPDLADLIEPICADVLRIGEPLLNTNIGEATRIDLGDGQPRSWVASFYPLRDLDGAVSGVSVVVLDVTDQRRAEVALQQKVTIDQFLSEISSQFINLPGAEINRQIESVLERVGEFLDLDRSTIGQFSPDGSVLDTTHFFHRVGIAPPPPAIPSEAIPWYAEQLRLGKTMVFDRLPDDLPPEAAKEAALVTREGNKSNVGVPLRVNGAVIGGLAFSCFRAFRHWPADMVKSFELLADILANALARKRADEALQAAMTDIQRLQDRLHAENLYLREEIHLQHNFTDIIGQSGRIKHVLKQVEDVAATESIALIEGETGTGKELLARAIHSRSARRERVMVKVNCATLPATLIESELFGREKGAYTGALTRQLGRFELADGSTLFLDEVGELPMEVQSKLLRVLQEGEFERLGSGKTIRVNVRVIAATNRDLGKEVAEGRFRPDLYYRLNVFPIVVPPLRDRRGDIPQLVWAFVKEFADKMGKSVNGIPRATMELLQGYHWPGNIRELRNVIERAMILCRGSTLHIQLPEPAAGREVNAGLASLEEVERRHITFVLEQTTWRVRGPSGAAEILGLKPTTLEARMAKLGIQRHD